MESKAKYHALSQYEPETFLQIFEYRGLWPVLELGNGLPKFLKVLFVSAWNDSSPHYLIPQLRP